jgi:predicted P-loop ATPase
MTQNPVETALSFLEQLRPGGPWVLTAIIPDGLTETITARSPHDARRFVRKNDGKKNLYYSVNPTRTTRITKASKLDIAVIEFSFVDLDPQPNETAEIAKIRYLAGLEKFEPAPTAIIDSGNGIQALWRLSEPIMLPNPVAVTAPKKGEPKKVYTPETQAVIVDAERRVKVLMETLGSVAGTQNIDRILRLPGTTNLPNAKKVKNGRDACPTRLIKFNEATCKLDDFPTESSLRPGNDKADDTTTSTGGTTTNKHLGIDWTIVEQHAGWLKSVSDLPDKFNLKGKMIVVHGGSLDDLTFDLTQAGLLVKPYRSWSDVSLALAAILKGNGDFSQEQIAAALMCDLECNQHVMHIKDQSAKRRAVERLITRSHDQAQQLKVRHASGAPPWREQRVDGSPLPSMHNARLAITALAIECSFDTFHNKLLFGYMGDKTRHTVESILGEVTDNGIIALRQLMSDSFGFDLTDKHARDAVVSLALEHCFDPVANMLAEAEAHWDNVKRLDRMAAEYLNCEDTILSAACIRKTMIAAVARVRRPGCKFDTITVLESPEGFNKSTAWRVLAGDENFSDEKIIGKNSREVQEQLSEVWIHENADLAGMKKAEVEDVKTYASRMIDIARPAFGHFLKKQKRHAIDVGTTNNSQYLQSQTGNRRFWPLRILKAIDIDLLRRDRLQLWGEAANYQSAGESLVLDEALWPAASVEQEARRVPDPWEDILAGIPREVEFEYFKDGYKREEVIKIIHFEDGQDRIASSDLLTYVLKIPVGQQLTAHTMKLATVMKHLGWERTSGGKVTIQGSQTRGYFRQIILPETLF